MINDGDQWVSEANQAPLELEFVPHVTESGVGKESFNETSNPNNQPPASTFPSIPTTGPSETSSTPFEAQSSTMPPPSPSIVSPSSTVPSPYPSTVPPSSTVPSPSTYIVPPPSYISVNEKGPDIEYDETNNGIRESLVGKLEGDEPYYLSEEVPRFEIDDETGWEDGEEVDQVVHKPVRRKKNPNRVVFNTTAEKIV
ncbi:pectinesterase inhibitor 10-like [Solanum pennellii]|uniref:Pectinesterase inhibitor 10-like n=1 Tax=Solanum pennellii TaxID=28526 RepID=A0ABM1H4D3_SOLPN|nr:pectinesterase inhibitor 10-like [Solanum pennellii]